MNWQPIRVGTHLLVLRWYDDAEKLIDKPEWWTPLPEGPKEREATKGSRRAETRDGDWPQNSFRVQVPEREFLGMP